MFTQSHAQYTPGQKHLQEKGGIKGVGGLNETGLVGVSCLHITIHPLLFLKSPKYDAGRCVLFMWL